MTAGQPNKPAVLYISYDGMLEPLGQSQVLCYLERLADQYQIHLISFEKQADWRQSELREKVVARTRAAGIRWKPLRYHKSPTVPATLFDMAQGIFVALIIALRHRVTILHARSYVAALIALIVKRLLGRKLLFDMRGFWADERVDAGLWPAGGRLYRVTKRIERRLLLGADHSVTLTHASAMELRRFDFMQGRNVPITVIPTCADLDRFRLPDTQPSHPFVLGYIGSAGTWYLFDEMLLCFRKLLEHQPDARLLIVNRSEQTLVHRRIRDMGIDPERTEVIGTDHAGTPDQIGRMTAGMALIKPVYSKIASAPTKLAEYLGCGIPCLGNPDIGDMESVLEGRRVGVILRGFSEEDLEGAVSRLIALSREPDIRTRCRSAAEDLFSLGKGAASYDAIYASLLEPARRKLRFEANAD